MIVIDLPKSGQASVAFSKPLDVGQSVSVKYFAGAFTNSILGGGYSFTAESRDSDQTWPELWGWQRDNVAANSSRFATRVQTKNESAAEVAELTVAQLRSMANENATPFELGARRAVIDR